MVKAPDNLEQAAEGIRVIDSVDETPPCIPSRRVLGGAGLSVVVHAVIVVILSLVLVSQTDPYQSLLTLARFDEPSGSEDSNWILVDTPEIPPVQDSVPNALDVASQAISNASLPAPEIDLNRLGNLPSGDTENGLPSAVAAVAAAVQGRVAMAGGQAGEVQFSLAWETFNDLDLHVIAPSGEQISYGHRKSRCDGELDVDMNAGTLRVEETKKFSDEPVENTRWLTHQAPTGRYTVLVHQYRWRNGQTSDKFELVVKLGDETQVLEGLVTSQETISVHRFQYVPSSLSPVRQRALHSRLTSLQKREEAEATKLFDRAMQMPPGVRRDQPLRHIIGTFPHTDAAIQAMQEVEGVDKK